jgi:pilus assembly protein CpaC
MKNLKLLTKSMLILTGVLSVLAFGFSSQAFAQEDEPKPVRPRKFIALTLGLDFDEKMPPIPKPFSSGGDCKKLGMVDVQYSDAINTLRFSPKREGLCTFTLKEIKTGKIVAEYHVDVRKSKLDAVVREMQNLLGDIEGINIKIVNNKVVVDGQILLPRDMNRIYNVVSQFGDQASSIVTLSPLAQKKIAEFISRDINNPEIEVRAVNDKFLLQGVANSEDEKNRAEIIAKTYVPALILDKSEQDGVVKRPKPANDGVINLITVKASAPPPPAKIVQLVVHYVEMKKNYNRNFRFQFTPSIDDSSGMTIQSGNNTGGGVGTSIMATVSNLIPKLNWAKAHGSARILESTSMIVQDGKTGVINSYTDFPYQIATPNGNSTGFKPVGIASKITPVVLGERSDSLNLDVSFKIDALVGFSGQTPISSTNSIDTSIVVRSGQSAAIGGLIRNQSSTDYNKPPANAPANPIISLYASKDFQHDQSQFVVFVTPIIKSSASAGSEKIKKKFRLRD